MSLRQMEFAVKVAEEKSFTRAAKKLKVSQPSLSQSILNLEETLGVAIFNRTSPLTLTHAGQMYISNAKVILNLYDELNAGIQGASGLKNAKIKIGLSHNGYNFALSILPKFFQKFSSSDIKIIQTSSPVRTEQMVLNGEVDLGVIITTNRLKELEYHPLKDENFLLAMPTSHPLAQRAKNRSSKSMATIKMDEIKNEKFVLFEDRQQSKFILNGFFEGQNFKPNVVCETESFEIAVQMVAAGIGITFTLSSFIKPEYKNLIALFKTDVVYQRSLALIHRKDKKLSKLGDEFLKMLQEQKI